MRSPSSRCLNHTVTLTVNTWGYDVDGGRTITSTSTTTGVACSFSPGETDRVADEYGRVSEINPALFIFGTNPGLSVDDSITYGSDVYAVVGVQDNAGRAAAWSVNAVLRT